MITPAQRASAGASSTIGFAVVAGAPPARETWTHVLIVFAATTLVPLLFDLIAERNDPPRAKRLLGWARQAALPAAVALAVACWLPRGVGAALLALPWLAVTFLLAAIGWLRVMRHGLARPLDRLCTDAGLMFSAVGGLWTIADRLSEGIFGFHATIVALTAAHFHYAGLLLPVLTGLVLRRWPESRFGARVGVAVVLGVPAVALGITATRFGWGRPFETAAGLALAMAGACVGLFHLQLASDKTFAAPTRALFGVAGVSLCVAMVLAAAYAVSPFVGLVSWLGLPQMRAVHGSLNAIGFGLCGVLAWRRALPAAT